MEKSEYDTQRARNINENKKFLAELGFDPYKPLGKVIKKPNVIKRTRKPLTVIQTKPIVEDEELYDVSPSHRRQSSRLRKRKAPSEDEIKESLCYSDTEITKRKVKEERPNVYGAIEGVEIGTNWLTRMECNRDGIHRPPVSGIHGGPEGAYSIALSGGYEDNIDLGECFTYTGEGGRDLRGTKANPKNLRTAAQTKDQTLTRGNLALYNSVTTEQPVRVIRGYKLDNAFAPDSGYRYDGLYKVMKAWFTTGTSGFGVWKFVLKRMEGQAPPPWEVIQ